MSSIVENKTRVGNFTSSKVYKIIKSGRGKNDIFSDAGITYIKSRYYERKLGRSLDMSAYGRSMAWGLFLERYVYSHFTGLSYQIMADKTDVNPNIDYHSGSTDLLQEKVKVGDIKCYEPLKFCKMAECIEKRDVQLFKKDFEQEYWQLVSNAVIHDVPNAESILYMPDLKELQEIKDMASDYDGSDQWKYRFIYESENYELAHVPNDSGYNSLNSFEFEVPKEDKELLIQRLVLAEEELSSMFL